jgi:alanyl aminopeptidase
MVQRPADETISSRRDWVSVAAHELAHQWFGDLVTMAWWDDTWLNESFASWLGEKTTDRFEPAWGVAIDRASNRSQALLGDSVASARRIRQPIASKDDIANAFDGVTYGKGEAVLEMVEAWLGEDVFRRGVKTYVDRHAWGNATAADFTEALSGSAAAGQDVAGVLGSFLDQAGAPVVSTELRCDGAPRLALSQRPYRALGSVPEPKTWRLPVCVRLQDREERTCTVLAAQTEEIPLPGSACPASLTANAGATGYYRTLLRAEEARRALETRGLTTAERVALVGDLDALVAAGDVAAGDALALVPLLAGDPDRQVVRASVDLVGALERLVPEAQLARFQALVRQAYGPRARALGWSLRPGDSEDVRLLRRSLLEVASGPGQDPELAQQAVALVGRWLDDPSVLDPELVVTALGAASATGDRQIIERLKQELLRTTDRERRERLLSGIGAVREPSLARDLLPLTLDDRIDPRESVLLLFRLAHRETRRVTFDFLKANYDALMSRSPQGELSAVLYLPWVGAGFCAEDTHAELEGFFGTRFETVMGGPRVLAQVLESVDQCVARKRAQQPSLAAYLEGLPD